MENNIINLKEYKDNRKHGYKINHYLTSADAFYSPYFDNEEYEKQLKLSGLSFYKRELRGKDK